MMHAIEISGQGPAAETLLRDWPDFVRLYHYCALSGAHVLEGCVFNDGIQAGLRREVATPTPTMATAAA